MGTSAHAVISQAPLARATRLACLTRLPGADSSRLEQAAPAAGGALR
jgi:hypothetical protein